uniref:Uncharacterized protein n=1 Tax=Meloidogyne enterolobii TaxID=390850 RepID=A0A6V7UA59_MELEN|nr:unnamed protein product [Meloidogyne enterolobii]
MTRLETRGWVETMWNSPYINLLIFNFKKVFFPIFSLKKLFL